jgi:transcriptional regulator with XRE-family HTH domain/tetratricopeptide (TPR) repeat protein
MTPRKGTVRPDGAALRRLREGHGWTQDELARRAGYHKKTVENAERGQPVSFKTLQDLAAALTVEAQKLRAGEGAADVSFARLPTAPARLVGRAEELTRLDAALEDPGTHVLSVVAWGGAGKSALVGHWLRRLVTGQQRGAVRVFAWSFDCQAGGGADSADLVVEAALRHFGDPEPGLGSPWDRGERLARLVRSSRTLLVLDGLSPLQHPDGPREGRLRDQAVAVRALLRELAVSNQRLCLVTTRLPVADLLDFEGDTAARLDLQPLAPRDGAALLREQGARGEQRELEQAAQEFGGHPLTLSLLGGYLCDAFAGDVLRRQELGDMTGVRGGGHARRVMESYEAWLGPGPELELLSLLGLFAGPADPDAVAALRAAAVPDLSGSLARLSRPDWGVLLARLRRLGLLDPPTPEQPDALQAHPLVREHFSRRLREAHAGAWRQGHDCLSEHYRGRAPELPETVEEMALLYAAVAHGCRAGRAQEALDRVYWPRIARGREFFSIDRLGATAADLAALAGFFERPWDLPRAEIAARDRAFVLGQAGILLFCLGRLEEAIAPLEAGLKEASSRGDRENASILAIALTDLHLTRGDLKQAASAAREGLVVAAALGASAGGFPPRQAARAYGQHGLEHGLAEEAALYRAVLQALLAEAVYHQGRSGEARDLLRQARREGPGPGGCLVVELLLEEGDCEQALALAQETLGQLEREQAGPLSVALADLTLGRCLLARARRDGTDDLDSAADHLHRALEGLRRAGHQDELPRGLLARAELRRVGGDCTGAEADLEEALALAARCGMALYEADALLGLVRLRLDRGNREDARQALTRAQELIERTDYRRRAREAAELDRRLSFLT